MKHLSVLIKPASAACNLRCQYCFYADVSHSREVRSYGNMNRDVMTKMIDNIYLDLEDGDQMTFAFQGGEPLIVGLDYFEQFVAHVKSKNAKVHVQYVLQTNGTLINEKWCAFLKKNNFLIGLSIDGNSKFHDFNRMDVKGKGTFSKVMVTKKLFDKFQIEYNILCVLTNQIARHPTKIFKFLLNENIRYIQFIPCLSYLDEKENSTYALKPERFASFYKQLFLLWNKELEKGNYISISIFDHIVSLLSRGVVGSCGMLGQCQPQYVIESNGDVYPCDFYVLDEFKVGNITKECLNEIFQASNMKKFIGIGQDKTSEFCVKCQYFRMCRGGCKRMRHAMYLNKTETYCGYQDLLNAHFHALQTIAIRQQRRLGS